MKFSTALFALIAPAMAAPAPSGPIDKRAPLIQARAGEVVPGKYIVKLKEGASSEALDAALSRVTRKGKKADLVYRNKGFKGFAGKLDMDLLEELRYLPEVWSTISGEVDPCFIG
jgi:hypothetical protein